jgi:N-acetylmuramoyl-L-alanine amidase
MARATVAPPAAATAARRPSPRTPHPLVVLDAGHGGRDPGAEGVGGILEKDVVLDITRLVARRLAARLPVDVLMTRSDDSFVPIERRLAVPGEGATLFISLHANACTDPSARGLEVFYGGGAVRTASTHGNGGPAALLGRSLKDALDSRIGGVRGAARPADFSVLVRNPVPSALIEIGYLTHPGEAARAQDAGFQELLADAIVQGVTNFLRASAPPL